MAEHFGPPASKARKRPNPLQNHSEANPATYLSIGETGFEPATPWSRTAPGLLSPLETAAQTFASPGNPGRPVPCQATESTIYDDLRGEICRPRVASERSQAPAQPAEPLLSVKEVAARLGVCRATAYRLCERGEIAHVRVSNAIRVSRHALDSFLASKEQSAGHRRATVAGGTRPMQLRPGRDDAEPLSSRSGPGGALLDCSPIKQGSSVVAGGEGSGGSA